MIFKLIVMIAVFSAVAFGQMPAVEPGVSLELAKWRAARYSDVRYKLDLTLEKMSPVLKGTMEIRVKVSEPTASLSGTASNGSEPGAIATGLSTPIILDWRKIRGSEALSTISKVSLNGESKNPVAIAPGSDPAATTSSYEERDEHLIFRNGVVAGENVIKLDFTSPILTSGSAITRYIDKEDGSEYIYSLFVPSDASTAFPVFDQPDLKARFMLNVTSPVDWKVTSNEQFYFLNSNYDVGKEGVEDIRISNKKRFDENRANSRKTFSDEIFDLSQKIPDRGQRIYHFRETRPISTYVFAFAAGPWVRFAERSDFFDAEDFFDLPINCGSRDPIGAPRKPCPPQKPNGIQSTGDGVFSRSESYISVRKSQAAKFKPHAAEVFRLNREGIKFLESYFDYKFPFPKYDIVLIPEFPFGGMEHAGATFLREASVIFPQEPTKNDYINRATLIFHEAAHQWFGDTVTMRWFDDLWLKEGFATFMGYKALEKVMPEYNAWKVFYERVKQAAYQTDSTKGTTPIYQEIKNLSAAKSAYGNIVYNKAPAFLRQAEFYLGEDKFQTAVRAFLKKHEFGNAGWEDLVREFQTTTSGESREADSLSNAAALQMTLMGQVDRRDVKQWATFWVNRPGLPILKATEGKRFVDIITGASYTEITCCDLVQQNSTHEAWPFRTQVLVRTAGQDRVYSLIQYPGRSATTVPSENASTVPSEKFKGRREPEFFFGNYKDYGYGIFLLDPKSRDYVLKNIGKEKDDFLRSMMWGALWDSVREAEMDPREYVELVVKELKTETDESTIQTLLSRVSTAMRYYMSEPGAVATGSMSADKPANRTKNPVATAPGSDLNTRLEALLIDRMQNAPTPGQKITYYRSFLGLASSENARRIMKEILKRSEPGAVATGSMSANKPSITTKNPVATAPGSDMKVTTKDRFDIVSRLIILGDPDAPKLLAELEKTETSDDAKRYAYAAKAGFATAENKAKYWNDFVNNKDISESWIEAAFGPFNNVRHSSLTLPYLERALASLPDHKRNRKIFFVNGWLGAFIGGQKSEEALKIVNDFLAKNPDLDKDLRLKILENVDVIERAVKIRARFLKKGE